MPSPTYSTLFARVGRIIARFNSNLTLQGTTLLGTNSGADDILDEYADRRDLVPSVQRDFEVWANQVAAWNAKLVGYATATLGDLQLTLNSPSAAMSTILPLLRKQMVIDGQSIAASAISAPSIVAGSGGNTGTGVMVASVKDLDGNDDQRVIDELLSATCTSSSTSGGEVFQIVGYPRQTNVGNYKTRGSGTSTVVAADSRNLITNGGFEDFTSNVPDSWTLVAGTAGTHVAQELTDYNRGSGALSLDGDGSQATVTLTYDLSGLTASTIYAANAWVRKSGTVSAGSNLQVAVTGTGFTTVNLFNADPDTLTTSYAAKSAFFATPVEVPTDLKLTITWTTANTAGASAEILVDDVAVVIPTTLGHVKYALFNGAVDFSVGDNFVIETATDGAGVISTWFGRVYNATLPTSGSPTIADSLAT